MKTGIYCIIDTLAHDIVGQIVQLHKADAAAIRMFTDVLAAGNNGPANHPEDHQIVRLAWINHFDYTVEPAYEVLLTGLQWLAVNNKNTADEWRAVNNDSAVAPGAGAPASRRATITPPR